VAVTTRAELAARVDDLAERVRSRRLRAKLLGPIRRVMYFGTTLDHLECGHNVFASDHLKARRHCDACARGNAPTATSQISQARRDGRS
jgi:hypothetical protein